jgi:hypothetical protein
VPELQKGRRRTKKRGGRLIGALAFAAGALGTTLLIRRSRKEKVRGTQTSLDYLTGAVTDRWARPGMSVTFRAELMPGRSRSERTFRVASLLPSGRVTLEGVAGEHPEGAFEPLR